MIVTFLSFFPDMVILDQRPIPVGSVDVLDRVAHLLFVMVSVPPGWYRCLNLIAECENENATRL